MIKNLDNSDLFFPQDERISFVEEGHIYLLDNTRQLESVSSVYSKYFKPFDSDYWAERKARNLPVTSDYLKEQWDCTGKRASFAGTHLHKQIEDYLNGSDFMASLCHFTFEGKHIHEDRILDISTEIDYFHEFVKKVKFTPFRTEWRVYDESLGIAGTIDLTCRCSDGTFEFFDWKRSKSIIDKEGKIQSSNYKGINGMEHIADCSYMHYALQQNLYKYIVEKNYGLSISKMTLVILHPDYTSYRMVTIPSLDKEIELITSDLASAK